MVRADKLATWAVIVAVAALLCVTAWYSFQECNSEEYQIYREGQAAYLRGAKPEDSPYPEEWDTLYRRSLWLKGWKTAEGNKK